MTLFGDFVSGQNNVTYTRMRQVLDDMALQEGVVGAGDFKVTQNTGTNMQANVAAGGAWVGVDTGTRNGLAHVISDAVATVTLSNSNGTNPRVDQVILRYNDTSVPTGAGNVPTIEVLTGTATAGATLTNRTGAAALLPDAIRLADILVPAGSTAVTNANIVDRRPWARGAYFNVLRGSGYTTTSTTYVAVDATNLAPRIECSGVPLRVIFRAGVNNNGAGNFITFGLFMDGTQVTNDTFQVFAHPTAGVNHPPDALFMDFTPTAGSHVFTPNWKVGAGTATMTGSPAAQLIIEEIVRPNASNT